VETENGTVARAVLPIEWLSTSDAPSYYANNVVVQSGQNEGYLLFFEMIPPMLTGTQEEIKEKLETVKVQAKCKARLIVPRDLIPKIIAALESTNERIKAINAASEEGPDDTKGGE
jgi:hypothetical protein